MGLGKECQFEKAVNLCLFSLVWYSCRGEVPIWNDIWIQYYECSTKKGPYSVRTILK